MSAKSKKIIIAIAAVVTLLVLGVVGILLTEFDSPGFGRLALNQIGKNAGLDLKAEGFRLNLLRGLELQQVEASGQLPDGELLASMDRLVLKHRPADLLSGTLTVTEIVLERPRVELLSTGGAAAPSDAGPSAGPSAARPVAVSTTEQGAEARQAEGASLNLAVSTIRLNDGTVIQRMSSGGTTETTEIRGLDLELNDLTFGTVLPPGETASGEIHIDEVVIGDLESADPAALTTLRQVDVEIGALTLDPTEASRLAGATLRGEVEIAEVISGDTQARDTKAQIELDGGQLRLQELQLTAPQGDLRGHFEAAVGADPVTYSLRLDGDALNTGILLGLGDLGVLGASQFELSATGNAADAAQLLGNGRLTLGSGNLPDHPVFAQLETILGNVALIGVGYESFPLEFDIRSQRLHLAECELQAGPVSLTLSGWLDFDGPLEMQLAVLTPREGLSIKEIPLEVLEVLAEDDGRVNLPMLISGTTDLSSVALNRDVLAKLGQRYAQKTVEKELTKALSGLFGKKKEKKDG